MTAAPVVTFTVRTASAELAHRRRAIAARIASHGGALAVGGVLVAVLATR